MPAKWFICPDSEQIEIRECIDKGCRLAWRMPVGRCLPARTLRLIGEQRKWNGVPSTTQLLKGTRETVLEILYDYPQDPQDAIFRIIGTKSHGALEQHTGDNELNEERLFDDISSGQFDIYDDGVLIDTKTSGSYKVMRALGLKSVEVETGEVYKSGKKKGLPKTKKEIISGYHKDRLDWAIQLNDYRMKIEACGFPVHTMAIECLVRDGNTFIAQSRGIDFNGRLVPINRISDHWIRRYMTAKARQLHEALKTGEIPPKCSWRETWGGKKCKRYCNVREICGAIEKQRRTT